MEIEIKMIVVNLCVILEKVAWNVELQKVPYFFQINIVGFCFYLSLVRAKGLSTVKDKNFKLFCDCATTEF